MATLPLLSLIAVLVILPGALSEFSAPHGSLGALAPPGTIFSAAAYQLARRSRRSSGTPTELGSVGTPHSSGLELMGDIIRQRRSSSPKAQLEHPLNPPEDALPQDYINVMNMFDSSETTTSKKKKSERNKKPKSTTPMPEEEEYEIATLSPEEQKKFDEEFASFSSSNATVTQPKDESLDAENKTTSSQPDDRSSVTKVNVSSTESTTRPTTTTTEKPSHLPGSGVNSEALTNIKKVDTHTTNSTAEREEKSEHINDNNYPPPGSTSQTATDEVPKTDEGPEKQQAKQEQLENGESGLRKGAVPSRTTHTSPAPVAPEEGATHHEGTQEGHVGEKDRETSSSGERTPNESKDNDETTAAAMPPHPKSSTLETEKNANPAVAPKSAEVQDRTHYSNAQQSDQFVAAPDLKQTTLVQQQGASQSKPEEVPRAAALVGAPYLKNTGVPSGQRSQSSSSPGFQYSQSLQDLGTYRQPSNQDLNPSRSPQSYQGSQGVQSFQSSYGNHGAQGVQSSQSSYGNQGAQGVQSSQSSYGNQGAQGLQSFQSSHGTQDLNQFRRPQSYQSSQGVQSFQSSHGNQGLQGLQSYLNPQRTQTIQDLQGLQGLQGLQREGAPRAAAATQQRSQQGKQGQASPLVFTRWFGDVMQWSDAQDLLHKVKTGQELPKQDYRGVRITYKVNGYSEPPLPQPTKPTIPLYSPPLSNLQAASGYGPAAQPAVHPGALYHQQFATGHLQTSSGLSAGTASSSKPAIIVVPSQYTNEYLPHSHSLPYQPPAASLSAGLPGLQGAGYSLARPYNAPPSWSNQVQAAQPSMPPYIVRVYTKQEPQGPYALGQP